MQVFFHRQVATEDLFCLVVALAIECLAQFFGQLYEDLVVSLDDLSLAIDVELGRYLVLCHGLDVRKLIDYLVNLVLYVVYISHDSILCVIYFVTFVCYFDDAKV